LPKRLPPSASPSTTISSSVRTKNSAFAPRVFF